MFHLTTHAFFKALLFLGSGSVIYGCHHEQDIFRMGGLAGRMKLTFVTFTIGVAAIIGLPFLAGFFSKDAILYLAYENSPAVFAVLAFTAILTAFYMLRLWKIVFLGAPRSEAASHAHEGGFVLGLPLAVLAVLAAVGGYTRLYPRGLCRGDRPRCRRRWAPHRGIVLATSLGISGARRPARLGDLRPGPGSPRPGESPRDPLQRLAPGLFGGLVSLRDSFDRAYTYYIAKIQQRLAMLLNFIDVIGLAGFVVRGGAGLVGLAGLGARAVHVGRVNAYVYWFLAGVAAPLGLCRRGFSDLSR